PLDCLRRIVLTLDQRSAAPIADAFNLRRIRFDMVDGTARFAGPATCETGYELLPWDVDFDHRGQLFALVGEDIVEGSRLRLRSREAIEKRSVNLVAVRLDSGNLFEANADNRICQLV